MLRLPIILFSLLILLSLGCRHDSDPIEVQAHELDEAYYRQVRSYVETWSQRHNGRATVIAANENGLIISAPLSLHRALSQVAAKIEELEVDTPYVTYRGEFWLVNAAAREAGSDSATVTDQGLAEVIDELTNRRPGLLPYTLDKITLMAQSGETTRFQQHPLDFGFRPATVASQNPDSVNPAIVSVGLHYNNRSDQSSSVEMQVNIPLDTYVVVTESEVSAQVAQQVLIAKVTAVDFE